MCSGPPSSVRERRGSSSSAGYRSRGRLVSPPPPGEGVAAPSRRWERRSRLRVPTARSVSELPREQGTGRAVGPAVWVARLALARPRERRVARAERQARRGERREVARSVCSGPPRSARERRGSSSSDGHRSSGRLVSTLPPGAGVAAPSRRWERRLRLRVPIARAAAALQQEQRAGRAVGLTVWGRSVWVARPVSARLRGRWVARALRLAVWRSPVWIVRPATARPEGLWAARAVRRLAWRSQGPADRFVSVWLRGFWAARAVGRPVWRGPGRAVRFVSARLRGRWAA
ncbi:Uncharacterised protein [Nocardia cyriacigeorgica]|uniref:Uncharacterized protein n=1 Tax=Nocardia cyriacigeorgica TaxID=135487 RepID=A0A4U8WFY9_9NOCA|nr:Uncharacterised protein [Nocardia cyriacigeorgica]